MLLISGISIDYFGVIVNAVCAYGDLLESLRAWRLWTLLGWLEIRQRYARSKMGPFWLTISMGVMVCTLGVVYGALFGQKLDDYLPTVAFGLVVWGLLSSIVNEGSQAYIVNGKYIRYVRIPKLLCVLQVGWRNAIIFAHNFVIVLIVLAIFGVKSWLALILFIPGFVLLLLNALWMAGLSSLISARFRDFPQIVSALMQLLFYITPILFNGRMLSDSQHWIVVFNPFSYLVDVVRQPLLGEIPSPTTWLINIGMVIVGWIFLLTVTGRYHKRIPYWV